MLRKISVPVLLIMLILTNLLLVRWGNASPIVPVTPIPAATSTAIPISVGYRQRLPIPSPTFSPELEKSRARQSMEAALQKYLRYWGPRYQVAPVEVSVDGEWAHGVAYWQSQFRPFSGPIHILAHRLPDGSWQALMPSVDGLYLQWAEAIPERLVSTYEKNEIRALAFTADALRQPKILPGTPLAVAALDEKVGIFPETVQEAKESTPIPISYQVSVDYAGWEGYISSNAQIAIVNVLNKHFGTLLPSSEYVLTAFDVSSDGNWARAVVLPKRIFKEGLESLASSDIVEILLEKEGKSHSWRAYLFNTPEFLNIKSLVPKEFIDFSSSYEITSVEEYRFPWSYGRRWWKNGGWHTGAYGLPNNAVDFQSQSNSDVAVLAASRGLLNTICDRPDDPYQVWLKITNADGTTGYGHLDKNSINRSLLGQQVSQGTHLGNVYNPGHYYSTPCGYGDSRHLHFVFPTRDISMYDLASNRYVPASEIGINTGIGNVSYVSNNRLNSGSTCDATGLPSGYTKCAEEGGRCNFSGTQQVYYGANSCYKVKSFTGGVDCNNNNFGDPLPGVHKACYIPSSSASCDATNLPSGYIKCADENGYCSFSGTQQVYYGANSCYKVKTFTNGVGCNNGNFGDPLPGVSKSCYVPPSCNPNADQVALYANAGWGGNCITLGVGNYPNPGYLGSLGNDNAESIRVGSNVQAILYEHDNYQGRSETFTNDDSNLGDNYIGANTVSSIKVQWRVQPPSSPQLQAPPNGFIFNEGTPINLAWSSTGSEYFGEVWGGPGGTLPFGWQSTTYKNLGPQWAGYTYYWHIKARNSAGESGWSSIWTFTVKPAAPSNLSAQTISCRQTNLYWTDNSGNEEGYKIYRNGSYVGQVGMNATSYQDTDLNGNTYYSYYVRAFRGSIESDSSNTVNITTPSCAPPKPDLTPSQWGGWQYPVVPSSITGTNVVNTLYAGYPTYIDWGLTNSGNAGTGGNTYGALYIDNVRVGYYNFGDVQPGVTWAFFDWMEVISTPGWHTLKSIADPDNLIAESDETNNIFQKDFYWVPSAPFFDDMEGGLTLWTATGLWHLVRSPYIGRNGSSSAYWYGRDETGNYDTGTANSGDLTSPPIYIPSAGFYLRFWYRYETETHGPDWDQRWVQISVDGGPFTNVLQLSDDPMMWWLQGPVIDLSAYAGHVIQIRFHFDTIDEVYNAFRGWYIDDFEISTVSPPSCSDAYEPNDNPPQATPISYGQSLNAEICPGGDYDFYKFTGLKGDKVVIDIDASINGSWLDPYVFLLDSNGKSVLAQNDDEILGEVTDSRLGYQLPYDGTYYIKLKAWNHPSVGGANYFYSIRLFTDNSNPSWVAITSPENDAWLNSITETVTVVAVDNESGINRVEFLWHNADWRNSEWIWLGADYDGRDGWSWVFSTSSLSDQKGGAFYVWAFDWVGNWTGAGVWNLGIDRTAPTAEIIVSPMYRNAPFLDFHVWWWGSDNLSDIAKYDIQYRDGPSGIWTDLMRDTTETYYRFIGQNGHTYHFRARTHDRAGNVGNYSDEITYTVQVCEVEADLFEGDDTPADANLLETDGTWQMHNFHTVRDQDWVKFLAIPGVSYTVATINEGGHADTVLYLYDRDGNTLLDSNDDDPNNWPASRLIWQPLAGGVYYIKIEHWDSFAYGCTTTYGLSVTPDRTIYRSYLPLIIRSK